MSKKIQIVYKVKPKQNGENSSLILNNQPIQYVSQNHEIYSQIQPIIQSVLEGHSQAIMTYGKTGSGKSRTILGNWQEQGILQMTAKELMSKSEVAISAVSISQEKLSDLLNKEQQTIKLRDSQINLKEIIINEYFELEQILAGCHEKDVGRRSITIYILTLKKHQNKLYFVDNYGSERISKTNANQQDQKDCQQIGATLNCLGRTIQAVNQQEQHIPFRDSKLTQILKNVFKGQCKAAIILTCSLEEIDKEETLSTLRFGQYIQKQAIKNKIQQQECELNLQVGQFMNSQQDYLKTLLKKLQSQEITESELIDNVIKKEQSILKQLLQDNNNLKTLNQQYIQQIEDRDVKIQKLQEQQQTIKQNEDQSKPLKDQIIDLEHNYLMNS